MKRGRKVDYLPIGTRWGRLVVIDQGGQQEVTGKALAVCRCDCHSVIFRVCAEIRVGKVTSCGCAAKDNARKQVRNTPSHRRRIQREE